MIQLKFGMFELNYLDRDNVFCCDATELDIELCLRLLPTLFAEQHTLVRVTAAEVRLL